MNPITTTDFTSINYQLTGLSYQASNQTAKVWYLKDDTEYCIEITPTDLKLSVRRDTAWMPSALLPLQELARVSHLLIRTHTAAAREKVLGPLGQTLKEAMEDTDVDQG